MYMNAQVIYFLHFNLLILKEKWNLRNLVFWTVKIFLLAYLYGIEAISIVHYNVQ